MEQKTSNFQVIVLIVFGFFVILGVILFATAKFGGTSGGVVITPVTMWGTLPKDTINKHIQNLLAKDKGSLSITYVEKSSATFEKDLVEAVADGIGPDIVILPQDILLKNINKQADSSEIIEACNKLHKAGITLSATIIFRISR